VRSPVHRLLPALVLLVWMVPGVAALGVGLHLTFDHRGPHQDEQAPDLAGLPHAATHGHHHDTAVPDHEHHAAVDGFAPALRPSPAPVAMLAAPTSVSAPMARPATPASSPRRGPPDPLFTTHCSLLL
jgi:hypothetical protein